MERLTQARSLMGCKRFFLIAGCLLIVATALFAAQPAWRSRLHSPPLLSAWSRQQPARQPPPPEQPPSPQEAAPVQRPPPPQQPPRPGSPSCRGARGQLINDETTQDLPTFRTALPVPGISINDPADYVYPEPTYGSYRALGLEKTWMTFRQRYEAYGYGETEGAYPLAHVSWETVDWGQLQQDCLLSQPENLTEEVPAQANWPPRFRLAKNPESPERAEQPTRPKRPHAHHPNHPHPPRPPESPETPEPPGEKGLRQLVALPEEGSPKPGNGKRKIGRQAIILRTWSTYRYTQEDLWNVRSIITEASLANQGRYTVFLLVDVKREDGARIHTDDAFYRQVLEESVPKEFWGLAVLFHESLQRSWYPKIREYQ
ncbi:hypothetical protein BDY17DRAFT_146649 [Neohortaea acidophila]|uniref:Uncharacterized protein n=1 Tax=Neohortaea acidophila TaxID=245834 RepID=A0A6A6PTG4_9PEZI|nr:uncharacterized protein BDY17DRAFT_146649 [Neohortaea acidophila]KAF2483399.1 hypothetical protein BDY17DRAFT_146649 [Neohortaea acidophila]